MSDQKDTQALYRAIDAIVAREVPRLERRKAARLTRRTGGPGYREVEERPNGLFVGNLQVDGDALYGWLSPSTREALDIGENYRLRQCPCGQHFIAELHFHLCNACRQGKEKAVLAAFTAERTARRLQARATSCAHCAHCGRAMVAARSTKRFCSDKCRNASR
jgi:hypothetical protein